MTKFSVLTFGCRVNQADSFDCERALAAEGGERVPASAADLVVVNTCAVTDAAEREARRAIRRIARENPSARIVATGCYATRRPDALSGLPQVARVVPNAGKAGLGRVVMAPEASPDDACPGPQPPPSARTEPPTPGTRGRTAYPLRVQTGCDERCSYCIVPSTRGAGVSRPLADVVAEAIRLAASGYREVWLTGVHLGSYGRDLSPALSLADLLGALDGVAGDVSFRLGSLEPMDCSPGVIDLIARSGRFAPHLHLPAQHASDDVLAAMRRPYTFERFRALVEGVLGRLPDVAIGTDVIAGFPGETADAASLLEERVSALPLAYFHVFPYSDRPGTEAATLASKVAPAEVEARAARLRVIAGSTARAFARRAVGQTRPALTLRDGTVALTDNYLKVRIPPGRARNERVAVRVLSAGPLRGEVEG